MATPSRARAGCEVVAGLRRQLAGRKVVLIDDVLDSGQSLEAARRLVLDAGATAALTCRLRPQALAASQGGRSRGGGLGGAGPVPGGAYGWTVAGRMRGCPDVLGAGLSQSLKFLQGWAKAVSGRASPPYLSWASQPRGSRRVRNRRPTDPRPRMEAMMKTMLAALASASSLATSLAAVAGLAEAQARVGARGRIVSQPHFRGGGGGFRGGYSPGWGYRGGYRGYSGGAWAGATLGFALGAGLAYRLVLRPARRLLRLSRLWLLRRLCRPARRAMPAIPGPTTMGPARRRRPPPAPASAASLRLLVVGPGPVQVQLDSLPALRRLSLGQARRRIPPLRARSFKRELSTVS